MKKIWKIIFSFLMLLSINSCNTSKEKFLLEGNFANETLIEIDNYSLKGMIENEESFILVVLLKTCSTCESFKNDVLNPYIKETHSTIYSIDLVSLESYENYDNKPYVKEAPTLLVYNEGKNINTLKYSNDKNEFKDIKEFKNYMNSYIIEPKLLEISEELLDSKISNKETFILYIGWNKCGDCSLLEERIIDSYLKENDLNIDFYYLESDKYRINKPKEKPVYKDDFTDEEKNQYNIDLENWNNWILFATKYNFVNYRNGRIPTIQLYENGIMTEWIVYNNDIIEENVVIDSFFDEYDGMNISKEKMLELHDKKVIDFLNKHK